MVLSVALDAVVSMLLMFAVVVVIGGSTVLMVSDAGCILRVSVVLLSVAGRLASVGGSELTISVSCWDGVSVPVGGGAVLSECSSTLFVDLVGLQMPRCRRGLGSCALY